MREYGSSIGWGLAYGLIWWFVGALTLLPLLGGGALDWSARRGGDLFGSLVGHAIYGLIVGATADRVAVAQARCCAGRGRL